MRPGLIACDLDGTLLQSSGRASARSRRALMAAVEAGWVVVAATGRPRDVAEDVAVDAGCEWLVCLNGTTTVALADGSVVEDHLIPPQLARDAAERVKRIGMPVSFGVDLAGGAMHFEAALARHIPLALSHPTVDDAVALIEGPVRKLSVGCDQISTEELLTLVAEVLPEGSEVVHAGLPFVEIGAPGVTKASALEALRVRHGVSAERTVAFGDGINDHSMLKWAARGVAMANADARTRALADELTESNDEHGVASVVEDLLGLDPG